MNSIEKLASFLLDRESDIANHMEDFGELESVFEELFGRKPAVDPIEERAKRLA